MSSQKLCYTETEEVVDAGAIWKTKTYIGMIYPTNFGKNWSHCCRAEKAVGGGKAQDNRRFINAVFWILRTGAPWRDLPASYGGWKNTHRRFCRWRDKGIWEKLMKQLIGEHELEHGARAGGVFSTLI